MESVPVTSTEAELISEINKLKKEKNAVILSHYYMPASIQQLEREGGVADFKGDSLGLSIEATKVKAQNIIFCGVNFMAETAKILNPAKNILIPDKEAGCSLASSITAQDVIALKKKYPGVPVMAYINTYAETKAECDVCCTSRNALKIAAQLPGDTIIFIPDKFMGENLKRQIQATTKKNLILWNGTCEVHEQFSSRSLASFQQQFPEAEMLMHWEVPNETVADNLFTGKGILGSTNDILTYAGASNSKQFILASECDFSSTLKAAYPEKEFITPCIYCPYMKKINLQNILKALQSIGNNEQQHYEISLNAELLMRAAIPVKRMMELS